MLQLRVTALFYLEWSESHSVVSDSLWPHGLYSPWNSPGQNTGVGSLWLLQGIFQTQEWNPGLPRCRQILYQLSHNTSWSIRAGRSKRHKEKRSPLAQSWLHFLICFLLLPMSLPYVNWASQEGFVLLEVLTLVLRPSFVLFSLSFSHHHSGLLFPILST